MVFAFTIAISSSFLIALDQIYVFKHANLYFAGSISKKLISDTIAMQHAQQVYTLLWSCDGHMIMWWTHFHDHKFVTANVTARLKIWWCTKIVHIIPAVQYSIGKTWLLHLFKNELGMVTKQHHTPWHLTGRLTTTPFWLLLVKPTK